MLSKLVKNNFVFLLIAIIATGCSLTGSQVSMEPTSKQAKTYPNLPLIDNDEVRYFVKYYSTTGKRFITDAWKRRDNFGEPVETILKSWGIPQIFVSLATVESGFRPDAKSPCGAAGLWQFMPATAERFGLRVGTFHDDRYDISYSTVAAARYLRELHDKFGDWYLALAAYNAGPARIKSALHESHARSYFELVRLSALSQENSDFVAKVVAVATIELDPTRYGFRKDTAHKK